MNRTSYEDDICRRLRQAECVPFREVAVCEWRPTVANCHDNVDEWVRMNPNDSAVRGWVVYANLGVGLGLTAHSVVRGADGKTFDITPLENEKDREAPRKGMRFVEHLGTDEEFFALKRVRHSMACRYDFERFDLHLPNEVQLAAGNDQEGGISDAEEYLEAPEE